MTQKITSLDNPRVKRVKKLEHSSAYRNSEKSFVIEGARLCSDALLSKVVISEFYYTEAFLLKQEKQCADLTGYASESFIVSESIMKKLAKTENPQGAVCVCEMHRAHPRIDPKGTYMALEDLRDPSNLGTVARTAEALGIDGLILSKGCCDIYNPKVLRGSMGAFFRLAVLLPEDFFEFLSEQKNHGMKVLGAAVTGEAEKINRLRQKGGIICVIGNEGDGLTEKAKSVCETFVTIPMQGRAESLNAAAAASIIMWELVRQEGAE